MHASLVDVHNAIGNDELVPCFQPLVELRSGLLTGFEVLARWNHPELGLILPDNFISLAIKSGLIDRLTQKVLGKAFQSCAGMPKTLSLAVNISPIQLRNRRLPIGLRDLAQQAGFPMQQLTIEITESALIDNLETAGEITRELKAMGCRLSLDDFGTGYSSLRHLQALPFDELKVDQSFVREMSTRRESRKIVAATLGLGHSLGIATVAEGVETEEQAEMLLRLGCHRGQGWLYGHPEPAERISAVIAAPSHPLTLRADTPTDRKSPLCLEALPVHQLAQLRAIYDGAPVGLCFLDRDLRHISLNRRLAEMNGTPIVAHLGRTVKEMNPAAAAAIEPYLRRVLEGEAISNLEVSLPGLVPSEELTFMASFAPAFDESGEVIGVLVSVMEITERKRMEKALQEGEEHYRNFVELSPHIPWVMDAQGKNLEVNSRWTDLCGQGKEQARNDGWLDAIHPEDVPLVTATMQKSLRSGEPMDVEYRIKHPDGSFRWVRSRGFPQRNAAGQIVRWYGTAEDVDDRRREKENLFALLRSVERCRNQAGCPGFCHPEIVSSDATLPELDNLPFLT